MKTPIIEGLKQGDYTSYPLGQKNNDTIYLALGTFFPSLNE